MAKDKTNKPDGTGYSKTFRGEIGTDGVERDWNGNVVPVGLDEETKAAMQKLIDGPRIRVIPSENDILSGNTGPGAHQGQVYVDPNESADAAAKVFKPGYNVTSAEDDGKTAEQKSIEAEAEKAQASTAKSTQA